MKFLLSILLMFSLIDCSGSKSANNAEESEAGTELADGGEFSEDFEDDLGIDDEFTDDEFAEDTSLKEDSGGDFADASGSEEAGDMSSEMSDDFTEEPTETMAETAPQPVQIDNSEMGWHTVEKGETLMLIAFKIYGDYSKWRDLARANSSTLNGGFIISAGTRLQYPMPAQKFEWSPEGNPYLIKVGDTLGTISRDTYGTNAYWKNIWQNNTPLIKNPNKIFAGFTIYTPNIESRGVANE